MMTEETAPALPAIHHGNGQDTARTAVLAAARAYDDLRTEIAQHEAKLGEAAEALEHRNSRIEQLEFALAEERARCQQLQGERDMAVLERAELHVMFANIKAQLDAFATPLPTLPSRRRRRPINGDAVAHDGDASQAHG